MNHITTINISTNRHIQFIDQLDLLLLHLHTIIHIVQLYSNENYYYDNEHLHIH